MPKVSTQVYMLDRKIWRPFRPCGNGRKRAKCDQFFCPTSDFFDFCNPCFFNHTFTNDVDFVDKAYAEICDHSLLNCSFARLKNKLIGVLGTNVATMSWLHLVRGTPTAGVLLHWVIISRRWERIQQSDSE